MQVITQMQIRNNPRLYQYLRENSYWYKYSNRDPNSIEIVLEEMKKYYKLTATDKMENLSRTFSYLETFLEIMK